MTVDADARDAAAEAYRASGEFDHRLRVNAAVDAYLAKLVEYPPDEVVQATMGWLDDVAAAADGGDLENRDCQEDAIGLLRGALSVLMGGER